MADRVVLITGAGRGIGRATALMAAVRGWDVAINYRSADSAAAEVASAVEAAGRRAALVKGDVASESDVLAMFETAMTALGPLTGAVVNAGIVAPSLKLMDVSAERIRRIFEVNTVGAYLCAREAARRMAISRGGKGGSIVIVSSVAARIGAPGDYVDYAGSKAALDTLGLGLAKELGPEKVRVNVVRPGLVDTEIHASGGDPDRGRRLGAMTPMGRQGEATEIAEAILWFLSDASSYATGALLDVSGGR